MTRSAMNDRELTILRSDRQNLAFFFRADFPSGTKRLFSGAGDYPIPVDEVETEGGIYTSVGQWGGGLPEVDHLINAQAQGVVLNWPGVNPEVLRIFVSERQEVVGARAAFGWGILDERYRSAGSIRWCLRGILSHPRVVKDRTGPETWRRVMSTTLISGAYARRRGMHAFLSRGDQRRKSPTDASCDRTGGYSQQTTRDWPD